MTFAQPKISRVQKVIIVGGGFGGLAAAKTLSRSAQISVTLVDRRNYHLFQPLLYQVATAALNPADIAVPIRSEFSKAANVEVRLGEVTEILLNEKKVRIGKELTDYDYLILACGAQHSYFGNAEWEERAPGLKTLEQATEIRRRILTAFEEAENETEKKAQVALMTFVIVGGGPTGVELAGAIAEISRNVLDKDFRRIDPRSTKVILVEAGDRILPMFSKSLSQKAKEDLEALGVEVRLSEPVTQISQTDVCIGKNRIDAHTVIWAAGVEPSTLNKILSQNYSVPLDKAGRVFVEKDFSLSLFSDVFVIGDQCHFKDDAGGMLPGLAPVALQAGRYVAKIILGDQKNKRRKAFEYVDKGQMATIGKKRAVLQFGKIEGTGFIAWLGWLFIHLFFLIGFRNKVSVLWEWIWNYFFSKPGARLITRSDWRRYTN